MFCPECSGEYRPEITTCPECAVELVVELPPEPEHDTRPFEIVFATGEPALLPVVKSLLDETDIPYIVKGDETTGLFPAKAVGLAIDPKAQGSQILVPGGRAAEARELLGDLEATPDTDG